RLPRGAGEGVVVAVGAARNVVVLRVAIYVLADLDRRSTLERVVRLGVVVHTGRWIECTERVVSPGDVFAPPRKAGAAVDCQRREVGGRTHHGEQRMDRPTIPPARGIRGRVVVDRPHHELAAEGEAEVRGLAAHHLQPRVVLPHHYHLAVRPHRGRGAVAGKAGAQLNRRAPGGATI